MLIYLLRHGTAVRKTEAPERSLSEGGRAEVERLAGRLAGMHFLPGHIYHSPKRRAAQTAEIIAASLPGLPAPEVAEGLLPTDDPGFWSQGLEKAERDVLLVGHLPHLPRLASLLLLWDPGKTILDFTPGTIACLEQGDGWRLKWMLSPDALK